MKKELKHYYFIILAVILVTVLMSVLSFVYAAQIAKGENVVWIEGKLQYDWVADSEGTTGNQAAGSVTPSEVTADGGKLTVTAANSVFQSGCFGDTDAEDTTTTVTVKNVSAYPLKITKLTTNLYAKVVGIKKDDVLKQGDTFTITVYAPCGNTENTKSTTVTGTVTIEVEEQTSATVTLAPSPHVSYILNGITVNQNGSEETFEAEINSSVSLPSVTAPSGYQFAGWRVNGLVVTDDSFTVTDHCTVYPLIVSEETDLTAAVFKVGSVTYPCWEDAVAAAASGSDKTVVLNQDYALPTNMQDNFVLDAGGTYVKPVTGGGVEYILPKGVTLLVPYNAENTVITNSNIGQKYTDYNVNEEHKAPASSEYRRLTLASGTDMTVYGSVSVASSVWCMSSGQCGPYGLMVLDGDSKVTFESGSKLYAFGYIIGTGTVDVKSGAKGYCSLSADDYPGSGSNVRTLKNKGAFPFSKFSVRNVQARMTVHAGATMQAYLNIYGTNIGYNEMWISFVGSENALFTTDGTVTVSYEGDYSSGMKVLFKDEGRQVVHLAGNSDINPLTMSVYGIEASTSDLSGLPIPYNYDITVDSGTVTVKEDLICSKGSSVTVAQGATAVIPEGKNVYILDSSEDKQQVGNQGDATLNINGTVEVYGNLLTSNSGANITSSEKTGEIVLKNGIDADETETVALKKASNNAENITLYPAVLHNNDGTYAPTHGAPADTTFSFAAGESGWVHEHVYEAAVTPPTCTEQGYTTHTCFCDDSYVDTYTQPLGHDLVAVEAVAPTCTETGRTAGEDCSRCDYTTREVVPANGHSPAAAVKENDVAPTCTKDGGYDMVTYCSVCGEKISTEHTTVPATGHTPAAAVKENDVAPTCTKDGSYDMVTYCSVCSEKLSTKHTTVPATGHTPAAAVQENVVEATCTTEGSYDEVVYCTVCSAELSREAKTTPVSHDFDNDGYCTRCGQSTDPNFKIKSARLALSNNIVVVYTASVSESLTDPYMRFTFNGSDYEVTGERIGEYETGAAKYSFSFEGVTPEKMGDNICATLYATRTVEETAQLVHVVQPNYSVKTYCVKQLGKASGILKNLLSDVLAYGAAAQSYTDYKTEDPVTSGVEGMTPTEYEPLTGSLLACTETSMAGTQWLSATLQCGSKMAMVFRLVTDDPTNVSVVVKRVVVDGEDELRGTFVINELNNANQYRVTFTGINANEFDDAFRAELMYGDDVVQTLTYSVNSYIYSRQNDSNETLRALVRAIRNYGASAKAYSEQ